MPRSARLCSALPPSPTCKTARQAFLLSLRARVRRQPRSRSWRVNIQIAQALRRSSLTGKERAGVREAWKGRLLRHLLALGPGESREAGGGAAPRLTAGELRTRNSARLGKLEPSPGRPARGPSRPRVQRLLSYAHFTDAGPGDQRQLGRRHRLVARVLPVPRLQGCTQAGRPGRRRPSARRARLPGRSRVRPLSVLLGRLCNW